MSHQGESVIVETHETPEQRLENRERGAAEKAAPPIVEDLVDRGPSPEDALRAAQKALEDKDKALVAERSRAQSAESLAAQARDQAARERQGRQSDRKLALTSAVEAAKADKVAATSALRTAREAGDFDAEMKAQEQLQSANYRMNQATGELTMLDQRGDPTSDAGNMREQGGQRQQGYITPRAQAWIDAHPKYNTDGEYKKVALAAHSQALLDGAPADSQAYFRYLDEAVRQYEAANKGGEREDVNRDRKREMSFDGAPPSRQQGGHGGGSRQVKTDLGTISVSTRADGKLAIAIPPALRADFEEGARICNMDLGSYALEQVKISDERSQGGNAGLITEETRTLR